MISLIIGGVTVVCTLILGHLFIEIERAKGFTRRMLADGKSLEDFVSRLQHKGFFDQQAKEVDVCGLMWDVMLARGADWPTVIDFELQSTKASYMTPQCAISAVLFVVVVVEGIFVPIAFAISVVLLFVLPLLPQGEPSARRAGANLESLCWLVYNFNKDKPEECKVFVERFREFENLYGSVAQQQSPPANENEWPETAPSSSTISAWKQIVPGIEPVLPARDAMRLRALSDTVSRVFDEGTTMADGEHAAEAVRDHFDVLQRHLKSDSERLHAIMKSISERIGGPVVVCNPEGEVSVHPDVAAELDKPGNESVADGFAEMLRIMSSDARRRSGQA